MNLELKTDAIIEPLALADVKNYLHVVDDDDDALITSMIKAARKRFEHESYRSACSKTFVAYFDGFSGDIKLEKPPVQSIVEFKYLDEDSTWQDVDSTIYRTELIEDSGTIVKLSGYTWPTDVLSGINTVKVEYVAGYLSQAVFPENAKLWMLVVIGGMYENRQTEITGTIVSKFEFINGLIDDLIVPGEYQ